MAERLWQLEHVCSLGHPRPRLEDVSVGIRTGVTALVGGSGAGKTSLLNLLAGFERPDSGTIIESLCTPAGRLGLYWVPQDAGLWPHLTARAHLAAVAPGGPDDERVDALLRSFALCDRKDARPEQMSLGERARLSVARALASRAAVLVMDEPLAHVDPARTGAFWDEIKRWCEDAGTSIVYATHSPRSVLRQATDVICMQDGRAIWSGAVAELYHRPASRELMSYLGDGNWLEPDEAKLWLGVDRNRAECWRPETLALAAQDSGPLVVTASRHLGATTETLLARTDGEARRAFYHATPPTPPVPGQNVLLKLVATALVLLANVVSGGCGDSQEATLSVRRATYSSLPPEGPRIPAPRAVALGRAAGSTEEELYVLDTAGRVLIYGAGHELVRQWRMPQSDVGNPEAVLVLRDGRIAVADTHYHQIVFFDSQGTPIHRMGRKGTAPGEFIYPVGLAQDDAGNLYVCEYGSNDRVQKFTEGGAFLLAFGTFGTGPTDFQRPSDILWHERKLYVADAINNRILVFFDDGTFLSDLCLVNRALDLRFPYDLALASVDGRAVIYAVEYAAGRVTALELGGALVGRWGSSGRGRDELATPWGIAASADGRVVIADTGNRRIVELLR